MIVDKKKLKIAYFIDRLIHGGTELQLVGQINRLADKGIHQEIFCLLKSAEHDTIQVNCKVKILNIRRLISVNTIKKMKNLRNYLKRNGFNIVQTYFFDSTIIGVLAGKLSGNIRVFSCRRDLGFWYTPKLLMVLRIINAMTDGILVNSKAVKESVTKKERVKSEKIQLIPNGIVLEEFDYSNDERKKNRDNFGINNGQVCVGIIANMSRRIKRVDLFIYAAAYVLQRKKNIKFMILGDGKYKKELIELAVQQRIKEHIVFLERKVSKHKVLSALDIGVLTSDSEGFSNAIMEYMAAGLPVIATNVGGNNGLVQNQMSGFLTPPGDYKEIGKKMLLLAGDKKKRIEYGNNGRLRIEEHRWDHVIRKYYEYYQEQYIR